MNAKAGTCMKLACEPSHYGDSEFIETMPRFNLINGEKITNVFTYKVCEVLEGVLGEVASMSFHPGAVLEIRLSVKHSVGNYAKDGTREGYWVEAELRMDSIEIKGER